MGFLDILLYLFIGFVILLTVWMISIWLKALPTMRRIAKSPDKKICPEHGQYLHVCSQCK